MVYGRFVYRFLATRRWLVRTLAGLLLVVVCVRLGLWQLDRNDERSARNELIAANTGAAPVALDELVPADGTMNDADEWRQVEVRGTYDSEHQLLLRLRPLGNGQSKHGVHVITPLVTAAGAAILVDRGFLPSSDDEPDVPPPAPGTVEEVVRLRVPEDSDTRGDPAAGLIRFVNVGEIADTMPFPLYPAWAEASEPTEGLVALPVPEPDSGPHLSYAFQWFIFAVVGVTGFVLLIRAEAKGRAADAGDPAHTDTDILLSP